MAARPRAQRRAAPRRSATRKAQYSFPELQSLWIAAGGDPDKAEVAAAVAMAESRGRSRARSRNPSGGTNRGLWQIDDGSHEDSTFDPLGNARAAVRISKNGEDWGAWEAFVKGRHKPFLVGKAPDKSLLEKLATGPVGDVGAAITKPLDPLVNLGKVAIGFGELFLTEAGWRQIAKVVIGGALLLWALNALSKSIFDVSPARGVRRAATSTPAGKAAGAAGRVASKANKLGN